MGPIVGFGFYSTTFDAEAVRAGEALDLIFEGLDTFATVKLNDAIILECVRMFLYVERR